MWLELVTTQPLIFAFGMITWGDQMQSEMSMFVIWFTSTQKQISLGSEDEIEA